MGHVASKRPPTFIDPERLYSLRGFQEASGIAATRIREARLQGVNLPSLKVGKRLFVRGSDGIAYIERLAELSAGGK
ncbi:MAG TPA: hypothetical protein PJ982_13940 [Lacipirellulaceae bacterium]|nr:hypothetical protein [Lacipirellulaceae bacterium]